MALPADPNFADRVRDSFAKQGAMAHLGVELISVEAGKVTLELPFDAKLSQQHGFLHAGIVATALDSACGYAASTLMPAEAGVLTIEFKINLLAPGKGERFRFIGEVTKAGRTISVADGKAFSCEGERYRLCATMTATIMTVQGRDGVQG